MLNKCHICNSEPTAEWGTVIESTITSQDYDICCPKCEFMLFLRVNLDKMTDTEIRTAKEALDKTWNTLYKE